MCPSRSPCKTPTSLLHRRARRFLKHLSSFMDHNGRMNRRGVISMAFRTILAVLGLLLAPQFCEAEPAANLHGTGIVYLHGKDSWPGGLDGGATDALKEAGALIAT